MRELTRREFLKVAGVGAASVAVAGCAQALEKAAVTPMWKRPNILLAISDDQSWRHASAYGCKGIKTPAFDRVAKDGVLFSNAYAGSPGCSPSRAALLTGRNCWQIEHAGTHASEFPAKYACYPDLLEAAGYFVGYTGKGWGPGNWKVSGRTRNPAGDDFSKLKNKAPAGISDNDYAANFRAFLAQRPAGRPFCFWYGAHEPHRGYLKGIGLKEGKQLSDAEVPPFLPDAPEVRSDILDYYVEIEWFDMHLGRMLEALNEAGELENTLIVATGDNGMSFPRAKANVYEYGVHVPMAASWPAAAPAGRKVDDLVGFVDLAPTFLEAAGVDQPAGEYAMAGRSIVNILTSKKEERVDISRPAVFSSRERHSSSRYDNLGYPQRCMRSGEYLYIRNFAPERWPAGDPQKYDGQGRLGPMHGGYHDVDGCPTMDYLIAHRDEADVAKFFHLAVDKRPADELYNVEKDPGCLTNLAADPAFAAVKKDLAAAFERYLRQTGDPRILGTGDVFETDKRYSPIRDFPAPDGN
ncbi:MAG: sulfatase-like hydrolase/transferase [Phycisphaerae bacterium]|nr:sulfatase-like hydrolase/transferase [Phycisphaerae bacterium]